MMVFWLFLNFTGCKARIDLAIAVNGVPQHPSLIA